MTNGTNYSTNPDGILISSSNVMLIQNYVFNEYRSFSIKLKIQGSLIDYTPFLEIVHQSSDNLTTSFKPVGVGISSAGNDVILASGVDTSLPSTHIQ